MAERAVALARSITTEEWAEDAAYHVRRRRRSDWQGRRPAFTVRLPEPLAEQLRELSATSGLSASEIIGLLLWSYLRHTA